MCLEMGAGSPRTSQPAFRDSKRRRPPPRLYALSLCPKCAQHNYGLCHFRGSNIRQARAISGGVIQAPSHQDCVGSRFLPLGGCSRRLANLLPDAPCKQSRRTRGLPPEPGAMRCKATLGTRRTIREPVAARPRPPRLHEPARLSRAVTPTSVVSLTRSFPVSALIFDCSPHGQECSRGHGRP